MISQGNGIDGIIGSEDKMLNMVREFINALSHTRRTIESVWRMHDNDCRLYLYRHRWKVKLYDQ